MSGKKRAARGAELKTFGSTWEIVVPGGAKHGR
jgi:hypothetical protein